MDRLKGRLPGTQKKPSYAGASDSRSSTSSSSQPRWRRDFKGLDQVAGWVGHKGKDEGEDEHRSRPIQELRDPSAFPPPPKRGCAVPSADPPEYDDTVVDGRMPPPIPSRISSEGLPTNKPKLPPRLPPRKPSEAGARPGAFPASKEITDEDIRTNGGLSASATGALGRLGKSGISVPGFNIGGQQPNGTTRGVPPPPPRRESGEGAGNGSISELKGRFGQLSTRNSSASAPTEGTSIEEKKAAAKTANSFYKDPSSVSFSDARSALRTGQNFQQRHGEQVSSGINAAGKLQSKFDGSGNVPAASPTPPLPSRSATTISASPSPPLPSRSNSAIAPPPLPAKKKPPPLPPKKKPPVPIPSPSPSASSAKAPPPPPPIDRSTRPPPVPRSSRPSSSVPTGGTAHPNSGLPESQISLIPTDLDLALQTEWFGKSPLQLPPSIAGIKDKAFCSSSSWSGSPSGRKHHTLVLTIRFTLNLSTTKIKLTWDASAPAATVRAEQRHFPPPPPHTVAELQQLSYEFGPQVLDWCRAHLGVQVGNGECWTLAHNALEAVSGAMKSQGLTHGACVFAYFAEFGDKKLVDEIRPGDVLQLWSARWRNGAKAGMPDHTAVVEEVVGDDIMVLQQNVGGDKRVQRGKYNWVGMYEGYVRAFRPVREEYGAFNGSWE